MKLVSFLGLGVAAVKFPLDPVAFDAQPPPYHVVNVAMESASPDPITVRKQYEEARNEAYSLAALSERSYKASSQLEALLAENSFLQVGQFGSMATEDLPIVDVALSQGPELVTFASTVKQLEETARAYFGRTISQFNVKYLAALLKAKGKMAKSVQRHFGATGPTSFVIDEPSFRVEVFKTQVDEAAGSAAAQQLFGRKAAAVTAVTDGAFSELEEISKIMSAEFDKALSANVHDSSFLEAIPTRAEGFHKQLNIRMVSSQAPTMADMLANAMSKNDVAEQAFRDQVLMVELKLVQEINRFAAQLLKHVAAVA